jgi:hypothetical protein
MLLVFDCCILNADTVTSFLLYNHWAIFYYTKKHTADLHAHRIKSMVFGSSVTAALDDAILHGRFLEDELTLQVHLLKTETPEPYLFPQVLAQPEQSMEELPLLQDGMAAAMKLDDDKQKSFDIIEELAEEGVIESLAICGLIGLLMLAPQMF